MRLSFRQRLFAGLVALGAVPLAVAIVVLAIQANASSSPAGPRAALDEIAASGRILTGSIDTLSLTPAGKSALQNHSDVIARRTTLARRAETLSRSSAAILAVVVSLSGVGLVAGSIYLARRWSRSFSHPIENLIGWIQRIERGEPLPSQAPNFGTPEIDALATALQKMALQLDAARAQEVEQQRLLAFREVARRVAHEVRGPLTASKLALSQMKRAGIPTTSSAALEVLQDETDRLEKMAHEFAEFGRLPEGPEAQIDVAELMDNVVNATVPPDLPVQINCPADLKITGQYEPLRRAVQNLVHNAVEATDGRGIRVMVCAKEHSNTVEIHVGDYGSGVRHEVRDEIFQPYVTTKPGGTGLGLEIVKQVIEAHRGTVTVSPAETSGATFIIQLPLDMS